MKIISKLSLTQAMHKLVFKGLGMASVACMLSIVSHSAAAYVYDTKDKVVIEQSIETISNSLVTHDITPVIDIMPPKVLAKFADMFGVSVAEIKSYLVTQSNQMLNELAMNYSDMSYSADFDLIRILQSDIGRDYLLIPTTLQMSSNEAGTKSTGTLLALEDDGIWYLMRIESQGQIALLNKVYPDLRNLELFESTS